MWLSLCLGGQANGMLGPKSRGNPPQLNNPSNRGNKGTGKIENKIKIGDLVTLGHQVVKPNMQDNFSRGTSQ